jgi:MOSC domain-containing protein YiiM
MPAHLRAIYVKRFKKGPMDPRAAATLVTGKGIAGNANQGGRRQVVLLTEEGWREATAELGADLDPATRRGNLLLSGVDLENTRGRLLRIGPVLLRIWTECTPCYQMETRPAPASRPPSAPTGGPAPPPRSSPAARSGWATRPSGRKRPSRRCRWENGSRRNENDEPFVFHSPP